MAIESLITVGIFALLMLVVELYADKHRNKKHL
jgi:hypothetical protein